jgi:hypothetical protein
MMDSANQRVGNLSPPDPHAEDALQAHRRAPQEDGARMPFALPPALAREPSPQAYLIRFFVDLVQLQRPVSSLRHGNGS